MRPALLALGLLAASPFAPPAEAQDLVGATYHVASIAGSRVVAQTATLQVMPDGRVAGSGGCNRYSGPGVLADGKARFGAVVSTRMACAAELMAQEQALFAALQKATRYAADERSLTLLDSAGVVLAHLRRR